MYNYKKESKQGLVGWCHLDLSRMKSTQYGEKIIVFFLKHISFYELMSIDTDIDSDSSVSVKSQSKALFS